MTECMNTGVVSGVKCVYRGGVARWKHTLPPGSILQGVIGCICCEEKKTTVHKHILLMPLHFLKCSRSLLFGVFFNIYAL